MSRSSDVFMGFVSATARLCYDGGRNPDVEELRRYNQDAAQASCVHEYQRSMVTDDRRSYRVCTDCGKSDFGPDGLPSPKVLDGLDYGSNVNPNKRRSW